MNKKLYISGLCGILGFFVLSPLQAMEENKEDIKTTATNRFNRNRHLKNGDYPPAASFAAKVIKITPGAPDNAEATLEDYRIARDLYAQLAQSTPQYLNDAMAYASGVTRFPESQAEDFKMAEELYRKNGDKETAEHFHSLYLSKFNNGGSDGT